MVKQISSPALLACRARVIAGDKFVNMAFVVLTVIISAAALVR